MKVIGVLILACLSGSVFAQTEIDFERKYPKIVSYEVRPNIQMRAEFGSDGQVISVTLLPNRISETEKVQFSGSLLLDVYKVEEIFEELVAPQDRIGETKSLGYQMAGIGGFIFGGFEYSGIRVDIHGSRYNRGLSARNRCSQSNDEAGEEESWRRFCAMDVEPESVRITWTKRKPETSGSREAESDPDRILKLFLKL